MLSLYQAYMSGAIVNLLQTISTVYQLNFMLVNTCNADQISYDISTYCLTADCSSGKIIDSITKKFFSLTGAINNIMEQLTSEELPLTQTKAYFNRY